MSDNFRKETTYNLVLLLTVEAVSLYAQNEWPSPTLKEISSKIGYSEEMILESLEFGKLEPVGILQ
ncbi:hypothetical protein J2S74_003631 [Evansella vedderi]|uniref:Uncharacterized protein n=1 Tax=Evansella vedderi TaxID=38282 RepID=A0ABT9ZY99_9BACI|nr:hypothetical protein [Evansella vedderi]MDQ0256213.1 hypothetical protein [Evansella vedderi]